MGLERLPSDELFLQRTRIWFSIPIIGGTLLPVTSKVPTLLLSSLGTYTHVHISLHTYAHLQVKNKTQLFQNTGKFDDDLVGRKKRAILICFGVSSVYRGPIEGKNCRL